MIALLYKKLYNLVINLKGDVFMPTNSEILEKEQREEKERKIKSVLEKYLPFLVGITVLWAIFIIIGWDITNIEGIILLIIILLH